MGKSGGRVVYGAPKRGKGQRCLGCHQPIMYGDRCAPCANLARAQAVNRKRKPR
jgi:hypothetical protein